MRTMENTVFVAFLAAALSALPGCGGSEGDGATTQPATKVVYHDLETIRTSLRQPDGSPRILRLSLTVELAPEDAEAAKEDLALSWPNIHQEVILDLFNRKSEFVNHPKEMEAIRAKIQEILNANLDEPYIRRVLIKECVLQ